MPPSASWTISSATRRQGAAPIALRRLRLRNSQAALALLALRAGSRVEREWLAGLFWPDSDPSSGLKNLRNCLTDLRHALGTEAGRLQSPTSRILTLDLTHSFVDVLA